jgi:signal transduction histidine kinase
MAALVEAGMSLASEPDIDGLLHRIAEIAREVVGARYGAVGVISDDGTLSRFVYAGIDEATAAQIGDLPQGVGVLGALIEEGRPLRLQEITDHPRSSGFPPHHPPMHSFLGVPIIVRGHVFGRLYLTEKQGASEFSKDDERIALTLASQAGVAVENARLLDELRERGEALAVLEERERISKELHDGVIQAIYSVGLALQSSLSVMSHDPEMAKERIDGSIAQLDDVVRDVRSYIFELQPRDVEERGLTATIEELAKDHEVNTLATVNLALVEGAVEMLEPDATGHVVQIVREILSNIARHAQASHVEISCLADGPDFILQIVDDGVGFEPSEVSRGHGLTNLEERARSLGGSLIIESREPRGTRHALVVPTEGENG